eukprot:g67119.t1
MFKGLRRGSGGSAPKGTIQENAAKGNLEDVKKILSKKKDSVNSQDPYGESALHEAARHGHNDIADLLIQNKANLHLEATKNNGWMPLHIAAKYGKLGVAQRLVAAKANVNAKDGNGDTPLLLAAKAKGPSLDVAKFLLSSGADAMIAGKDGQTALQINSDLETEPASQTSQSASVNLPEGTIMDNAAKGNFEAVKKFVQAGTSVNSQDSYGETALHETARHGHNGIADLLIQNKANLHIEATKNNGWMPLHIAAKYGKLGVAQRLVAAKANVNAKDGNGDTPLLLAAKAKETSLDVARFLLSSGADAAIAGQDGQTALQINPALGAAPSRPASQTSQSASVNLPEGTIMDNAAKGNFEEVKKFVQAGTSVNSQDSYGETALHETARHGHDAIAAFLLQNKANVNIEASKNNSWQALHIAAKYGKLGVARQLIDAKADLNGKDASGNSPLLLAAKEGEKAVEVAKLLIRSGADMYLTNNDGHTAAQVNPALAEEKRAPSKPTSPAAKALSLSDIQKATTGFTANTLQFDPELSKPLVVSANGKSVTQHGESYMFCGMAFANKSFGSGKQSWVITVQNADGCFLDVGVSAKPDQGLRPLSGLHAAGQQVLVQKGCEMGTVSVSWPRFVTGTKVQCLLDMERRTLSFVVNQNVYIKDAVTNLPPEVWPAVHMREDRLLCELE